MGKTLNRIRCFFQGHDLTIITGEMYGVATHYRYCSRCPKEETRVFDFTKDDFVWVPGNLMARSLEVFVFANTSSCFYEIQDRLLVENKDYVVRWLRHPTDVIRMLRAHRWPHYTFAADWYEVPLLEMREVAKLFLTGHS